MATYATPRVRRLTVLGQDPGITYKGGALTVELEVPMERIGPGPKGARVHVVDFDASTNTLYKPLAYDGVDPYAQVTDTDRLVNDPRFHAQNVYAIVMATLARFEFALGRRAAWAFPGGDLYPGAPPGRGHIVKVAPHAFAEANAFYSRRDEGLLFGYFPGRKGTVFSCLAHDVVAHETTHALIDGLRPRYSDPSSPDQAAFHEGLADVVALLSIFRHQKIVEIALGERQGRIPAKELTPERLRDSTLLGLAEQMGKEMTPLRGDALRRSAKLEPSRSYLTSHPEYKEPHARGEVFVAAMMNAFLEVWTKRLGPLGLDEKRAVDRARAIEEGAAAANHLLTMAIRALDYAPPVDLHFSDYLSALITADRELYPDDAKYGYRKALLDWCRRFGIDPVPTKDGAEPGTWERPPHDISFDRNHFESLQRDPDEVFHFLWENRDALELHPDAYTYVPSVRPCSRLDSDGFSLRETIAEYVQILDLEARELRSVKVRKPDQMPQSQKVRLYGGGVLVFDEFGRLKFHIGSGVASAKQTPRLQYLWDSGFFVQRDRGVRRFAQLHRERGMRRNLHDRERW